MVRMMRRFVWLSGAVLVSGLVMYGVRAAESKPAPASAAKPAAPASSATPPKEQAPEGKVIFTFADQTQMETFAKAWRERQIILTRMAVLKMYWEDDQAKLNTADDSLLSTYHINSKNATKAYSLDTNRKVSLGRPPPAEAASQSPAGAMPSTPGGPATP